MIDILLVGANRLLVDRSASELDHVMKNQCNWPDGLNYPKPDGPDPLPGDEYGLNYPDEI